MGIGDSGASVAIPRQSADIVGAAGYAAASQPYIAYSASSADVAEQSRIVRCGTVDGESCNGVVKAVKSAGEIGG